MGDNFGLNDNYEYHEFELDSLDATSAYVTGAAATDWPFFEVAGKGPLQDVVAIKVIQVEIPFSWYVFNTVNQSFDFLEASGTLKTATIPVGNYTATALAGVLQTALNTASGGYNTYTVTYSSITQKFTFTANTHDFTFYFGAPTNSGNINPRLYIGFNGGQITSVGLTMESPNAVLASGPNYLYLNSTKLGSDVDVYLPKGAFNLGGGKAGPQIAKIPVSCNSDGIIVWQDPDPQKWFKYDQLQSLNSLDFYLSLGNTTSQIPLKLNGLSFSLKLGVLIYLKNNLDRVTPTAQNGRVMRREGPKRPRPTF